MGIGADIHRVMLTQCRHTRSRLARSGDINVVFLIQYMMCAASAPTAIVICVVVVVAMAVVVVAVVVAVWYRRERCRRGYSGCGAAVAHHFVGFLLLLGFCLLLLL